MKRFRFVFYEARLEWRNLFNKRQIRLVDDGISFWTGLFNWGTPGYSHVEGWIAESLGWIELKSKETGDVQLFEKCVGIHKPNPNTSETRGSYEYAGTCYTSTMRGKHNGTVSRPASEVYTDPKRWFYLEFEVTDESFEEAKRWADYHVKLHMSYALGDLLRFFMPLWLLKKLKLDDPEREICSEHCEGWAIRLWHLVSPVIGIRRILMKILLRSPRRLWRDLVRRHHVPTYSLATGKMIRNGNGKKVKRAGENET